MNLLQKYRNTSLLFFLLILASFLRLYRIADYMTFLGDEGRDVLVVYNILHGQLTLLGPTASVGGFFLGPIYYYFMAPFLWLFNFNPVGPAVMVAIFGVATVWFVYKITAEFFNRTTGLIAASLYAVSPLVVAYSRSSWNPNLMPFFSIFTLYLLYKAFLNKDKRLLVLSGISLGIAMQLHYLTVFLGAIIAFYIIFGHYIAIGKSIRGIKQIIGDYFIFLTGFIIGWSPFLAFEARHGFQNIQNIINFIFHPQGKDAIVTNGGFMSNIASVFFRLFARITTNYPPPEQVSTQAHLNLFIGFWGIILLATGSFVLLIYQFRKNKDNNKKLQIGLLLCWFIFGVGLFGFYRKNIYDYYFGFMFPLPFILLGNFIFFLLNKKRILRYAAIIILSVIIINNFSAMPFRYPPNRQLAQTEEISQSVLDKTNGAPFNFALITLGNSDHAYRYFFKINQRDPVVIQNQQIDPKRASVTDQLLVVCEDRNCHPLGDSLWEVAGFGRAEIVGEWPVSVVKVYKLEHYKGT